MKTVLHDLVAALDKIEPRRQEYVQLLEFPPPAALGRGLSVRIYRNWRDDEGEHGVAIAVAAYKTEVGQAQVIAVVPDKDKDEATEFKEMVVLAARYIDYILTYGWEALVATETRWEDN